MSNPPPPAEPCTSTPTSQAQSHEDQTTTTTTNAPTMPPNPSLTLTLILAATPSLGIGQAGALPWPMLKKEMAYFARVTKRIASTPPSASEAGKQRINAVIMGRKTWDSIPEKFRPLRGRLNVVLSRSAKVEDLGRDNGEEGGGRGPDKGKGLEGPLLAPSILAALSTLSSPPPHLNHLSISRIFVIGGASVYSAALELPQTKRILLTQIEREYECDTFFPLNLAETTTWRRAERAKAEEWTGEEMKDEGEGEVVDGEEVRFRFGIWERVE